ncbi:hypothetical protein [Fodinicola acaciae]|uniref:hypothetical protein n=1 Tax=Fodinicola acaciae TaxID=2681555 RepID=UPI0013D12405|nr:hypothetical protein [Fodinicola acaciae]
MIQEGSAADCTKRAIEVWQTKPVTKTPTWHTRPDEIRKLDQIRDASYCPGTITFDVSAAMAAQGSVTLEIRVPADVERAPDYGRTLGWNGHSLSVSYDSPPSILPQYQYNAGFPCDTAAPYRRVGYFSSLLQARATDPDVYDAHILTYEFAVWPRTDPGSRLTLTTDHGSVDLASSVDIPDGHLADEGAYSWQVRVNDGAETSAWSPTCSFVVDTTNPSPPIGTYDADNHFTFDGHGDQDIRGFEYSWREFVRIRLRVQAIRDPRVPRTVQRPKQNPRANPAPARHRPACPPGPRHRRSRQHLIRRARGSRQPTLW